MSLEGCRHGPSSLGFGPDCTWCREEGKQEQDNPALARIQETLHQITEERLRLEAEHQAAFRESVRLLPGFTEVRLEVVVGGDGFVRVYRCDLCAALLQPLAEAQQHHRERCLP